MIAKSFPGLLEKTEGRADELEPVASASQPVPLKCKAVIKRWNTMLLRGSKECKMYDKPFDLVSIVIIDKNTGKRVFNNKLWLTIWGEKRHELSLLDIYKSYRQRYDIEIFFRYCLY